ncbi:MAG: hypothetical protein JO035_08865 [Betaproteobacteria bacterium]|nr:hypothetical protein [Betaproteobacteria bacterium]
MRALFLFLVLANVAFFAWTRYFSPADAVADPAPLGRQIQPDKLRVVGTGETSATAAKPVPPPAVVEAALTAPSAPASGACVEWGSFTVADAPRAQKALEPLSLGTRLAERRTEEMAAWWVFIPPPAASPTPRQAALKKASELKALRVEDYFVVSDEGPNRWAISLGVFRTEEAAQARLAALRQQGVRSAQVGPRETLVPKIWLQVKSVDAGTEAKLKDIARQIDGSELRPCL